MDGISTIPTLSKQCQAFLYGDLEEDEPISGYSTPPDCWFEPTQEGHVLKLLKALALPGWQYMEVDGTVQAAC